jgi:hypothetical protein
MRPSDGILSSFRTEDEEWDVECTLDVVDALSPPEGELCFKDRENRIYALPDGMERYIGQVEESLSGAYMRIVRKGSSHTVQVKAASVPAGLTSKVIENSLEVIHHLTAAGGFLLHASWIQVGGKAILFTGPSGIGKSTQAALWQRHRGARLINGDRAAVFPMEGEVQVRGIPYCGSSGVAENCTMPLAAVVHLEQAKTTTITRLKGIKAFRPLWQECCINLWNPEDLELGTQSVADMLDQVPVFHLACTPDLSAVLALEKEGVI